MAGIYNVNFKEVVPEGSPGNQAYKGLFFQDQRGIVRRMTEAEGHEIAYNPETVERNPIGQKAKEDEVRSYRDTFGKNVIIKKGAPNYEFFKNYHNQRPTGNNARIKIFVVDFMDEEIGTEHNKYLAYSYDATCTVDSGNYTDGTLTVNFSQAGDPVWGVMGRSDASTSEDPETFVYEFTPSTKIPIGSIDTSFESVEIKAGEEAWVEVSFSPMGCPYDFIASSSDEGIVAVERRRQSVILRGQKTGTAIVTVTSTVDSASEAEIEVTVG
ncbi:MAG: hypothetical protein FWF29_02250 [Treponema sp.]|nr:hypothetical protein [Treponema sp.]